METFSSSFSRVPAAGSVYRCSVCGAELSVIGTGHGELSPVCCNEKMGLLKKINPIYFCPVCGSEIMLIRGHAKSLEPICCNTAMKLWRASCP